MNYNPSDNEILVTCKAADTLPIDRILEFQGDLKKLSKGNREKLIASICTEGFMAPIFVWDDAGEYRILDGHQRLSTLLYMRQKGWNIPMLPVAYVAAESESEAKRKLLKITSQYGEFNIEELEEWIGSVGGDIAEQIRLTDAELELAFQQEDSETVGDDDVPEVPEEPETKLGDLWELGEHRLLCGDSTDLKQVEILMDGKKANMVFTSPPYNGNTGAVSGSGDYSKTTGHKLYKDNNTDNKTPDEYIEFNKEILYVMKKTLSEKGLIFYNINYNKNSQSEYITIVDEFNKEVSLVETICWEKQLAVSLQGNNLTRIFEFIFLFSMNNKVEMNKGRTECVRNLWKISNLGANTETHKACFPVELVERALRYYSFDNFILYEPFTGSGTTIIACEKNHRLCNGMELDPHYCDITRDRYINWCEANGKEPVVKLNGEVWECQPKVDQ